MLQNGTAWMLLADGRRARVLVEPRRGATLGEPADWAMEIGPDELYDAQDRPPRSFDRVGAGRHAMDKGRSLHAQEEEKFLKRVADRLSDAEKQHQFDHLVIAAPPRALVAQPAVASRQGPHPRRCLEGSARRARAEAARAANGIAAALIWTAGVPPAAWRQ